LHVIKRRKKSAYNILFSNEGDDDDENHDDRDVQQFAIKSSRGCVYLTRKSFHEVIHGVDGCYKI
jgi:hypothetical protein